MEEKRKDLKITQQKQLVKEMVTTLNESHPSFYYLSTIEVANEIKKQFHKPGVLNQDKFQLVKDLTRHDIQILLSLHDR